MPGNDVCNDASLTVAEFLNVGHGVIDAVMRQQRALDFAQLNPAAAQFNLRIDSATKLNLAIAAEAAEVACPVRPLSVRQSLKTFPR